MKATADGGAKAYERFLADEARVHREGHLPASGRAAAAAAKGEDGATDYTPVAAGVAKSGDLGYVYGGYTRGEKEKGNFDPFKVVSHDGFEMQVEVRCQYRVLPENAPYVVQKLGSIQDLEANVIHPQIDGIFRAQVSKSPAIAYQQKRAEEQIAAQDAVRQDLEAYKVEVVSVMITNIHLPEALMKTTQEKNLAELATFLESGGHLTDRATA